MGIVRTDICSTFVETSQGDEEGERCMVDSKGSVDHRKNDGENCVRGDDAGEESASAQKFRISLDDGLPTIAAAMEDSALHSSCACHAADYSNSELLKDSSSGGHPHDVSVGNVVPSAYNEENSGTVSCTDGAVCTHHGDGDDCILDIDRSMSEDQTSEDCGPVDDSDSASPLDDSPASPPLVSSSHLSDRLSSLPSASVRTSVLTSIPSPPSKPKRSPFKFTFPKPANGAQNAGPALPCSPISVSFPSAGISSPSARRGSAALFPSSPRADEGKRVRKDDAMDIQERPEGLCPERIGSRGGKATPSSTMGSHVDGVVVDGCDRGSRANFQMASPSYPSPSLPPAPSSPSPGAASNLFPSMGTNSGLTNEKMVYELLHNPDWQLSAGAGQSSGAHVGEQIEVVRRTVNSMSSLSSSPSCLSTTPVTTGQHVEEASDGDLKRNGPQPLIAGTLAELHSTVRKIMEDAFWDNFRFQLCRDPPDFTQMVKLVEEIREELVSLAQDRLKEEIRGRMDTDMLIQSLKPGNGLDFGFMRGLLDYVSDLMLKLRVQVRDDGSRLVHQRLLGELSALMDIAKGKLDASGEEGQEEARKAFADAVVKGFRFAFDRLQVLKLDISNARLRAVSRVINSAAGVDYLQMQFSKQHGLQGPDGGSGPPSSVSDRVVPNCQPSTQESERRNRQSAQVRKKLVRTCRWMTDIEHEIQEVRQEVDGAVEAFAARGNGDGGEWDLAAGACHGVWSCPPTPPKIPAAMRTGVRGLVKDPNFGSIASSCRAYTDSVEAGLLEPMDGGSLGGGAASVVEGAGVRWQSLETRVRMGLVMIVRQSTVAQESRLAETLRLEVVRIRNLQDKFQRALVTAAGLLMVQQVLISRGYGGASRMDGILAKGKAEMSLILDDPTATVDKIGAFLGELVVAATRQVAEATSSESRSAIGIPIGSRQAGREVTGEAEMMTRMLGRALQPEDVVFKRMVAAISSAMRWLVLLDAGRAARVCAANALQRAGAAMLLDKVEELATGIRKIAKVNALIYEPWYRQCVQ